MTQLAANLLEARWPSIPPVPVRTLQGRGFLIRFVTHPDCWRYAKTHWAEPWRSELPVSPSCTTAVSPAPSWSWALSAGGDCGAAVIPWGLGWIPIGDSVLSSSMPDHLPLQIYCYFWQSIKACNALGRKPPLFKLPTLPAREIWEDLLLQ